MKRKCIGLAALPLLALTTPPLHGAPTTPAVGPVYRQAVGGFVSAKGERALVMGYPPSLEIWAYPLQLVSDYHIRFREPGEVDAIDAAPLLRRVVRTPTEVIRTFVGPDFTVKEHLFVPRLQAGAIIRYEVEGRPDVSIEASFTPSLNLMWPAALGGQDIAWNDARSGYVESEPLHHFSATIASREAVAHDAVVNRTRALSDQFTMLLHPRATGDGPRAATLVLALDPKGVGDGAQILLAGAAEARQDASDHAAAASAQSLAIETPDPAVNAALRSATLALDQAWACNDWLGCGELAGFGPSRPGRRPQYAWFFAGDGLIAMQAMLDAGQVERARDELAFVTRYQDPKTGMIWHELSQSAGLIDWAGRYPYMYVHVDISFQYLAAVADYLAVTGDVGFVRTHWRSIAKAWRYCLSVIDPATGLPRIPPGKEGQDEQHKLRDDIRLSSAWIDAADGYAALADAMGHRADATAARRAATRARAQVAAQDWDATRHFWLEGHTLAGADVESERSDAIGVLGQHVFAPQRTEQMLDRLASPDFVTDWGLRSMAASDPGYDPNLYSAGSVWALGTSGAAQAFWDEQRPWTAWHLWRGLVDWNSLDSAGHLHEVLAGDLYHPEIESVPEQTWSSSALLSSAVHGLLGIAVDGRTRSLRFAPRLPDGWPGVTIERLRVGATPLTLKLARDPQGMTLGIDNPGAPIAFHFAPMLPAGADRLSATVNGQPVPVSVEETAHERDATIALQLPTGHSLVHVGYAGAIAIEPLRQPPLVGNPSEDAILDRRLLGECRLAIEGWARPGHPATLLIDTSRAISASSGGTLERVGPNRFRLTLRPQTGAAAGIGGYRPVSAILSWAAPSSARP